MTYDIRLRAYSPGTDTVLGVLPETLSWDASVVHNNDGALTIKASQLADRGAILARTLNEGLDVALEVNTTGTPTGWSEPDNCRFLLVDRKRDQTDKAKVLELSLVSWSWLLNKICDLNTGALQGSKSKYAGQRMFPATSDAGDVMKKGLDEHDARSGPAVPIIRDSWTTTLDSNGVAWTKKLGKNGEGRAFPAGQPLHARLDALTTNGKCDWRTRGRGLRIYNPGTAGTDRSATVHLRYGDDLTDAPSQTSQADRVARILVKGDGKHKATEYDPSVPEHYGRWEAMIDSAGVKDDDDLEDAGKAALADRNRIKGEYTRTLTMGGKYLPFRDYNVGDYITAPGDSGDEVLRVMQITISRNEQMGLSGNIVLGDRFTSKDLALAGKVNAITGGSSGTSGNGTSGQPAPEDTRQAEAPAGFSASGSLVLGADHRWSVNLTASWSAVTTATDGTDLDVSGYKLWAQPSGGQWRELARTAASSLMLPGFVQGSGWTFAVQAIPETAKWESPWSTQVPVTFPADTTAPNKPSAPVVESQPSTVSVTWDGLDYLGAAMPADLDRVDVRMDTSNPPATVVAQMPAGGQYVALAEIHSTVYVSLVAYDTTGNPSAATTPVSVVVKSVLDDTDLAARLATAARFYTSPDHEPPATGVPELSWWAKADSTVWQYRSGAWVKQAGTLTGSLTANQIVSQVLAAVAATVGDLSADAATIQTLYAQAFTAATAVIGLVKADRVEAGAIDGFVITGATVRTAASGARVELNSTGLHGYNSSRVEKTTVGTDGTLAAVDAVITGSMRTGTTGVRVDVSGNKIQGYRADNSLAFSIDPSDPAGTFVRLYDLSGGLIGINPWDGEVAFNPDLTNHPSLVFASNSAAIVGPGGNAAAFVNGSDAYITGGHIDLTAATWVNCYGASGTKVTAQTTTSAANVRLGAGDSMNGRTIFVNTSLRAAKALIEDLGIAADAVLRLRPRTWFDKTEMRTAGLDPDTATEDECLAAGLYRIPGFIAEEVDPRFADYDAEWIDDGVDGVRLGPRKLVGVAYDRIPAALVVLAQAQQQQIEDLTGRLAAIEARLPLEA